MDFSMYFLQISVGCVALAPVVPWRAVGKGYYIMMLAIGVGFLPVAWLFRAPVAAAVERVPPVLVIFAAYGLVALSALGVFLAGSGRVGSTLTLGAAAMGAVAVAMDGVAAAPAARGPAALPALLAVNYLAGALLLGSGLSAMLLGHWYLVVKDLPVKPLKTVTVLFFTGLAARLGASVAAFLIDREGGRRVADHSFLFVLVYGIFSLGTPLAMSYMVWHTVKIRSTQAATGILYGVVAFLLMGEAAGRFVLIKTGFPL